MNILIVGLPHSGTTLLRRMLGSHPQIVEHCKESLPFDRYKSNSLHLYKLPIDSDDLLSRVFTCSNAHRIIHIQRNYDDLISSMQRRFPNVPFSQSQADHKVFLRDNLRKLAHITINYEDLVENPRDVLTSICCCIGIRFHERMLFFHLNPCNITNSGNRIQIPERRPDDINHELLRLWQINQPLSSRKSISIL